MAVSLTMKNLITNGDFSKGTLSWTQSASNISVTDGILRMSPWYQWGQFYSNEFQVKANHYYYLRAKVKSPTELYLGWNRVAVNPRTTGTNTWEQYSTVRLNDVDRNNCTFGFIDSSTSGFQFSYFDDLVVVNLTETFGAGNEPTNEEMDELIDLLGGWFDGEITVPQKPLNKPVYPVHMNDAYVSSPYDWRTDPFTGELRFHYAVDFASYGGLNIPIFATQDGIVLESNDLEDHRGEFIYLQHTADGYFSSYYHMSVRYVSTGDTVNKGDIIGLMGTTGASTGVHLDFRIYTKYPAYSNELEWATIDPMVYLAEGGDPVEPVDPVEPKKRKGIPIYMMIKYF